MKIITASDAAALIKDGDTVATGGFVTIGFARSVAQAVEERFKATGKPEGITLVHAAGQAHIGHYAHAGLLKRVIAGYYGWSKDMQRLALSGEIEAYNFPQGAICKMYRDIASGEKYHVTRIGKGTFVETEGGRLNAETQELLVFPMDDALAYRLFPINVAIIRCVAADHQGNLQGDRIRLETLALATAVKNSGGVVIAEVDHIATSRPHVVVPRMLVDYVVVAPQEDDAVAIREKQRSPAQYAIARRAAAEVKAGDIVNIGIGLPELVGQCIDKPVLMTTESGAIGGIPAQGMNFGAMLNMENAIDAGSMFDFYNGGGLDVAFLGFAQIDRRGNVNVSKFGNRLPGCGGFIDITQNTKRLVFVGTETAGGEEKMVDRVQQVTFNGRDAIRREQDVKVITDKGYQLTEDGLK